MDLRHADAKKPCSTLLSDLHAGVVRPPSAIPPSIGKIPLPAPAFSASCLAVVFLASSSCFFNTLAL
jgi:hypothetical protein